MFFSCLRLLQWGFLYVLWHEIWLIPGLGSAIVETAWYGPTIISLESILACDTQTETLSRALL